MTKSSSKTKIVNVFRYDPTKADDGHFDRFEVDVEAENLTTILDLLIRIQKEKDASLAFRYACRVSMCGSCAMVINGRERLACKTVVSDLKEKEIAIRPLSHFPVVKDLVVDMDPFFEKYKEAMPFFEPARETDEPAIIPPDSKERRDIGLSTECIACGCCVSSCSMVHNHETYSGPAALNRAFTLLADTRDGLKDQRMAQVLDGCYHCRTELNCTEVCPKEISPTRAIKYIQARACVDLFRVKKKSKRPAEDIPQDMNTLESTQEPPRRRFLKQITYGLGTATALTVGGVLASAAIGPALRKSPQQWIQVGNMNRFNTGKVTTVNIRYQVKDGFYKSEKIMPVMVARGQNENQMTVFNSRCTHLGCTVHWDEGKQLFRCACHGGAFNPDGSVNAGPPPRALDRLAHEVKDGALFVEVV
jgi:succinate dehydrogenase / fumarate reductase iron-sulfur subunit